MAIVNLPELNMGNIQVRRNFGQIGDVRPGHTHNFDHVTFPYNCRIDVDVRRADGSRVRREFGHLDYFNVRANDEHTIKILGPEPPPPHLQVLLDAAEKAGLSDLVKAYHQAERAKRMGFLCTYSHRDPQGRVVQEYEGFEDAYL